MEFLLYNPELLGCVLFNIILFSSPINLFPNILAALLLHSSVVQKMQNKESFIYTHRKDLHMYIYIYIYIFVYIIIYIYIIYNIIYYTIINILASTCTLEISSKFRLSSICVSCYTVHRAFGVMNFQMYLH